MKEPKNNLEVAITLPVQGIVLGKSLDTGEAVANHVEEENKPEKEKSNKRQRMGESNAPETEPKQEHAMKRNAKVQTSNYLMFQIKSKFIFHVYIKAFSLSNFFFTFS